MQTSHWVFSKQQDFWFFAFPLIVAVFLYGLGAGLFDGAVDVPIWAWVLAIGMIDAPHVYTTLYRTYFDPDEFRRRRLIYLAVPPFLFVVGFLLYWQLGHLAFWTYLAYFAIFHFVRQQYGWVSYSVRRDPGPNSEDWKWDRFAIYNATLFPLLWWHAYPKDYGWYVPGDLFTGLPQELARWLLILHLMGMGLYFVRDLALKRNRNFAKIQIILCTWIAWFGGLVVFENALATLLLIAIPHGVPYFKLVFQFLNNRGLFPKGSAPRMRVITFLIPVLLVATMEEFLWASVVGQNTWMSLPGEFVFGTVPPTVIAMGVALLTLPDATHFVYDTFLWRRQKR